MITHARVYFYHTDSMGKKNFKKKLGASLGKNKRETIHMSIMKIFLFVSDNFKAPTTKSVSPVTVLCSQFMHFIELSILLYTRSFAWKTLV